MVGENLLKWKNSSYNMMDKKSTNGYLLIVKTMLNLHLNEHTRSSIPCLLAFYSY